VIHGNDKKSSEVPFNMFNKDILLISKIYYKDGNK
jgi:hypothetical protein